MAFAGATGSSVDRYRLARRNISPLAKVAATGQKKAGKKKRQRRTI
jgi:hypothetical protein